LEDFILKKYLVFFIITISVLACNPQKKYNHSGKLIDRTRMFDRTPVELYEFPNGLRVAVSENTKAPVFSYRIIYLVGSRLEERGKNGLTHFLEHMMFRETKNYSEGQIDRELKQLGAKGLNAFTGMDQTEYIVSLPSQYIEQIIKIDAERMQNLKLSEQTVEIEKNVVLNEKNLLVEDSPSSRIFDDLKELAFQRHPYRNPIIGHETDIRNYDVDSVYEHYNKYYKPNNAIICIAGDVKTNHVLSLIDQYFSKIPSEKIISKNIPEEGLQFNERTKTMWLDIKKIQIMIGYHIPAANHENFAAIEFINTLLSKGERALLKTALSDPGIATVSSWYEITKDPSLYYINLTVLKSGAWKEAVAIVDSIFDNLKKNGVKDDEMERVLNLSKLTNYAQLESNDSTISLIEDTLLTTGKLDDINDKWDRMRKIGSETIQQIIGKYFYKNNRTVIMAFPKK
jgi:zinc protease